MNDKADTGRVTASVQKPTAGYAASDFLRGKIGSITACLKYQGIKAPGNEKATHGWSQDRAGHLHLEM